MKGRGAAKKPVAAPSVLSPVTRGGFIASRFLSREGITREGIPSGDLSFFLIHSRVRVGAGVCQRNILFCRTVRAGRVCKNW